MTLVLFIAKDMTAVVSLFFLKPVTSESLVIYRNHKLRFLNCDTFLPDEPYVSGKTSLS